MRFKVFEVDKLDVAHCPLADTALGGRLNNCSEWLAAYQDDIRSPAWVLTGLDVEQPRCCALPRSGAVVRPSTRLPTRSWEPAYASLWRPLPVALCSQAFCEEICNKIRVKHAGFFQSADGSVPLNNTTTTTTVLRPFVRDYPGELVPEGTLTHPPSWSSSSLYHLLPSTTIH